jgi:hypothetical protein
MPGARFQYQQLAKPPAESAPATVPYPPQVTGEGPQLASRILLPGGVVKPPAVFAAVTAYPVAPMLDQPRPAPRVLLTGLATAPAIVQDAVTPIPQPITIIAGAPVPYIVLPSGEE